MAAGSKTVSEGLSEAASPDDTVATSPGPTLQLMRTPHMNGMPLRAIDSYRTWAPGFGE